MQLSRYLLESIYSGTFKMPAQINIYFDNLTLAETKDIIKTFSDIFVLEQKKVVDSFVSIYGSINRTSYLPHPEDFKITSSGLTISFGELCMYYSNEDGDFKGDTNLSGVLNLTLLKLKEKYPFIKYDGYIAEIWSDDNGGGIYQWEYSSDSTVNFDIKQIIYEHVGLLLGASTESKGFWQRLHECLPELNEYDIEELIKNFILYYEYIPKYQWVQLKGVLLYFDLEHKTGYLFQLITMLSMIMRHRFIEYEKLHDALTSGYIEILDLVSYIARNTDYASPNPQLEFGSDDFTSYINYAVEIADADEHAGRLLKKCRALTIQE